MANAAFFWIVFISLTFLGLLASLLVSMGLDSFEVPRTEWFFPVAVARSCLPQVICIAIVACSHAFPHSRPGRLLGSFFQSVYTKVMKTADEVKPFLALPAANDHKPIDGHHCPRPDVWDKDVAEEYLVALDEVTFKLDSLLRSLAPLHQFAFAERLEEKYGFQWRGHRHALRFGFRWNSQKSEASSLSRSRSATSVCSFEEENLPYGWKEGWCDEHMRPYYFNCLGKARSSEAQDEERVWERPEAQDEDPLHEAERLEGLCKALRSHAMRFPASVELTDRLEAGGFTWVGAPIRSRGVAALNWAQKTWMDRAQTAGDSTLFSSMGIWISPHAAKFSLIVGMAGAATIVPNYVAGYMRSYPVLMLAGSVLAPLIFGIAAAMWVGRRIVAEILMVAFGLVAMAGYTLEAVSELCGCWGPYSDHAKDSELGETTLQNIAAYGVLAVCFPCLAIGLVLRPHLSFHLLFVLLPTVCTLNATIYASGDSSHRDQSIKSTWFGSTFASVGTLILLRRQRAMAKAQRIADEDAIRYAKLWNQLLFTPAFRNSLAPLQDAWNKVQCEALPLPKSQRAPTSIGELFHHADLLNDMFQQKLYDLCEACGGEFHQCDVKTEARALQKVGRSYEGHWRQLCDLVRTSLVFDSLSSLVVCLTEIGLDEELLVVKSGTEKMRIREDYDAGTKSGGYRDVQLCVLLNTEEARARGVHKHLAEVQLHLRHLVALKSEGGHASYVLRRNLSGR